MEQFPFAVETSQQCLQKEDDDGSSSLVTASSEGSLLESSFDPIPINYSNNVRHPVLVHHQPSTHMVTTHPPGSTATIISTSNQIATDQAQHRSTCWEETNSGLADVLSQFGVTQTPAPLQPENAETIDFTYVNVCETDEDEVDILLAADGYIIENNGSKNIASRGDILTVLLSGRVQQQVSGGCEENEENAGCITNQVAMLTEQANEAVRLGEQAKKQGNLQKALDAQTSAAKFFRDAAKSVQSRDASMANSLLLLSQTQARSALALKRVAKLRPSSLFPIKEKLNNNTSQKELLRATVRGALDNRTEADISDSIFLGKAIGGPVATTTQQEKTLKKQAPKESQTESSKKNPVDEMMELERELRNMDMALEMGNSIASLDVRTQHRMKSSVVEGSFMVVPAGISGSYMSSSAMWNSNHALPPNRNSGAAPNRPQPQQHGMGTAGVRARPNLVQNILEASTTRPAVLQHHVIAAAPPQAMPTSRNDNGLDSSWWGNSSVASQVLASSVISAASGIGGDVHGGSTGNNSGMSQPAYTKQLMRLLDSLTTLKGENDSLLREVEAAKAAMAETRAAKEQMRRFKDEYYKRFAALTRELEEFRKKYPGSSANSESNPVASSEFGRTASTSDQILRQEQLIKKLTADLTKEKEASKKKDAALRKYESFYREVKARSAQKAAQRQKETQQRQQQPVRHSGARVQR